jgi:hypothetical protein
MGSTISFGDPDFPGEAVQYRPPGIPMTVKRDFKIKPGSWVTTDFFLVDKPDGYKYARVYSVHRTREEAYAQSAKTNDAPVGPITKDDVKNFRVLNGQLWHRVLDKYGNAV